MAGTAYFHSVSKMKDLNTKNGVYLAITYKPVNSKSIIDVPDLAPTNSLFWVWFRSWRERKDHKWFPNYKNIYLKQFSLASEEKLELITLFLDRGDDVHIMCYCTDERVCHRSIIKEMLKQKGYKTKSI